MPETGQLKALDVDNGLALEDWRASGLGPCVAMYFERQVLGEYPHSEEVRMYPPDPQTSTSSQSLHSLGDFPNVGDVIHPRSVQSM